MLPSLSVVSPQATLQKHLTVTPKETEGFRGFFSPWGKVGRGIRIREHKALNR